LGGIIGAEYILGSGGGREEKEFSREKGLKKNNGEGTLREKGETEKKTRLAGNKGQGDSRGALGDREKIPG